MVAGVDVGNVRLNRGRKGVGFEFPATADKYSAIRETGTCFASRGNGPVTTTGNSRWVSRIVWDRGIVVLRFEDVESARADVASPEQYVGRQLALHREVPFVSGWNMIVAAGVVAHSNLVERRNVREIGGSRERVREFGIVRGLPAIAAQSRLRRSLRAEGIAERTRTGGSSRGATASRGKNELRTEGPLVHKAVAEHAHDARVVEDAGAATETGLTVTEYVIGESQTRGEAGRIRV